MARLLDELGDKAPALVRGYEMFTLDPGPRADMVKLAIGKQTPFPVLKFGSGDHVDCEPPDPRYVEGNTGPGRICPDCGELLLYGTGHLNCPGRTEEQP